VLRSYARATQFDHRAYKAWHAWALMNFTALSHLPKARRQGSRSAASSPSPPLRRSNSSSPTHPPTAEASRRAISTEAFQTAAAAAAASGAAGEEDENGFDQLHERRLGHVVSALAGFFRSISLGRGREPCLQDLLRLLTLWFRYGSEPRVEASLLEGFECVPPCNPMPPTLQPYASHPATLCLPPCNPMCPTLQPYVSQVRRHRHVAARHPADHRAHQLAEHARAQVGAHAAAPRGQAPPAGAPSTP